MELTQVVETTTSISIWALYLFNYTLILLNKQNNNNKYKIILKKVIKIYYY